LDEFFHGRSAKVRRAREPAPLPSTLSARRIVGTRPMIVCGTCHLDVNRCLWSPADVTSYAESCTGQLVIILAAGGIQGRVRVRPGGVTGSHTLCCDKLSGTVG